MTKRALSLEIAAVTLIALAITFWWALDPILIAIFMMTHTGTTEAELIRQIWHFRLVQPEWIGTSDQFWRWQQAETYARLAVVFAGWVGCVVALTKRYRRGKRRHLTIRCSERLAASAPHFP
jgi:hypothetical protein